jgi:hypothetical protein
VLRLRGGQWPSSEDLLISLWSRRLLFGWVPSRVLLMLSLAQLITVCANICSGLCWALGETESYYVIASF